MVFMSLTSRIQLLQLHLWVNVLLLIVSDILLLKFESSVSISFTIFLLCYFFFVMLVIVIKANSYYLFHHCQFVVVHLNYCILICGSLLQFLLLWVTNIIFILQAISVIFCGCFHCIKNLMLSLFLFHLSYMLRSCLDVPIKHLQTDFGGKYKKFSSFLVYNGISHRFSCPHSHALNELADRKHRYLVETSLTLLARASVPLSYWVDAFATAAYLINRTPTPVFANQCPYEKLFCKSPEYSSLRVFGCACYPNLRPYNKNNLQPWSIHCVFLGYSSM